MIVFRFEQRIFNSVVGKDLNKRHPVNNAKIHQGIFVVSYKKHKKIGSYGAFKELMMYKGYTLYGEYADTYEEAEEVIENLKMEQTEWFKSKPNVMIDLNEKFNVKVFDVLELFKALIKMEFVTKEEVLKFGKKVLLYDSILQFILTSTRVNLH